jgi:glutamate racemase
MSEGQGPIAIFDSGVGGLTVAAAIARVLPNESFVYLGDTARLPYGTKSPETITKYAVQATRALMRFEPKMVVVACNTASAVALPVLAAAYAPVPVIGVVEPGARAAVAASRSGSIAVIATEGTVRGGAYVRAIRALNAQAQIVQRACPLFVALAEEGWTQGPVPELATQKYLSDIFSGAARYARAWLHAFSGAGRRHSQGGWTGYRARRQCRDRRAGDCLHRAGRQWYGGASPVPEY